MGYEVVVISYGSHPMTYNRSCSCSWMNSSQKYIFIHLTSTVAQGWYRRRNNNQDIYLRLKLVAAIYTQVSLHSSIL